MKFGFVTCVRLGLDVMEEVYELGGSLSLVITLPDDRAQSKSGRVYLDDFCDRHGIALVKSPSVNDGRVAEAIREYEIDWLFIIGWSQIAQPQLLATPGRGVIGMHPTLLPEGRGRASVPWAIVKDLPVTGVTMFVLNEGVDTGPILAQVTIPLTDQTTATELYESVVVAHRTLLRNTWTDLVTDQLQSIPQDPNDGSVWPGRTPDDGELLPSLTVAEALRLVRATAPPYPGAFWRTADAVIRVWVAVEGEVSDGPRFVCRDGVVTATVFDIEGSE